MITEVRLVKAASKAALAGVPPKTIQRLLHLAGVTSLRALPLTKRKTFMEVLAVMAADSARRRADRDLAKILS